MDEGKNNFREGMRLRLSEDRQRCAEVRAVVGIEGKAFTSRSKHVDGGLGRQTKDVDVGRVVDLVDVRLAVVGRHAILTVVLEERVRPRTVAPDAGAVDNTDGPGSLVRLGAHIHVEILLVDGERRGGVWVWLHVWSFRLDRAHENILGALKVILNHLGMLRCSTVEPDRTLRFDEHTASVVDVDLGVVGLVQLVVGRPQPNVLKIAIRILGDVELHKRADTISVGGVCRIWVLLAVGGLKLGALEATNTEMGVPETGLAVLGVDVPLHEDGARGRSLGADDTIGHFKGALVPALFADLENGLGVVHVSKLGASGHENRPNLANDLDILLGRNGDGLVDKVRTVVGIQNLAVLETIDSLLDGIGIAVLAVTLGAGALKADERARGDVLILGLAALKEAVLTEKATGLAWCVGDISLDTALSAACCESIALGPAGHGLATSQKHLAGEVLYRGCLGTGEVNIVQNQRTAGGGNAVFGERGVDTDRSVDVFAVKHYDGTDGLILRSIGHVKPDFAVVESVRLHSPEPVPVHVDAGTTVVEGHVASGILLAAEECPNCTAVENEVRHETAGTVILEDTLLVGTRGTLRHVEDDVLNARSLGNLPVDASSRSGSRDVDDHVADLAIKVVLVGVPVGAISSWNVRIRVDNAHTLEAGRSLDSGHLESIADELRVVILNDRLADNISSRREIDNGWLGGGRVTFLATARAIANGLVDGVGIVGRAVTLSAVVLDVAVNLVAGRVGVEGSLALALDVGNPVAGSSAGCRRTSLRNRCGSRGSCRKKHAQREKQRSCAEGYHDGSDEVEL